MSLALVRIDDRLVHGQVVLAWGQTLRAARLLVLDDKAAASPWERDLLSAAASELAVEVRPLSEAAAAVAAEASRPGATILLLRSPGDALAAIDNGAALPEINLGGLHYAPGKERVLDFLYLDQTDRRVLRELAARGVKLVAQDVPSSRPLEARSLLGEEVPKSAPGVLGLEGRARDGA